MVSPGINVTSGLGSVANEAVTSAAASQAQSANNVDTNSTFSSIGDLQAKAPSVYNAFMQFFAVTACNQQVQENQQFSQTLQEEEEEEQDNE